MTAQTTFVAQLQEALRKRGKPIRYRKSDISIEPVIERTNGEEREKLEIECPFHGTTTRLCVHVWDDRWIWIDARRSSKAGWVWQYSTEGRLVGSHSARDFVALFEESLSAGHWDEQAPARLENVWKPALATGPKAVL
jgi:hypothetical protein